MLTRREFLATMAGAGAAGFISPGFAATWPERTVTIVVPFAAGGNTDGIARMIAQRLTDSLGQSFIVENRVGAGGALAAEIVARAKPDGYTMFLPAVSVLTIVPKMMKTKFDPVKDFAAISNVATNPFVLVVNKDVPVKTVPEFVAYAKAHADKMSYASAGLGTLSHLAMVLFLNQTKLDMVHVPYKGNAPAIEDIVAGHVPVMFSNLSDTLPQIAGGNVRAIAVSGANRSAQLKDVPTVAESGYPTYEVLTWNGLVAPAGTPKDIIDKAAKVVGDSAKDPAFAKKLADYGVDPLGNTPDEFHKMIESDVVKWASALDAAGIKQQ